MCIYVAFFHCQWLRLSVSIVRLSVYLQLITALLATVLLDVIHFFKSHITRGIQRILDIKITGDVTEYRCNKYWRHQSFVSHSEMSNLLGGILEYFG
jgi:hypothetical protein